MLTAYFSGMGAIIEAWGGTVEKFIGDAIAEGLAKAAVDAPRALQLLERAHASFEQLGMPFETAWTKEELARMVPVRARNLLAQALATYERLGAAPHASRVRAALGILSPTQA